MEGEYDSDTFEELADDNNTSHGIVDRKDESHDTESTHHFRVSVDLRSIKGLGETYKALYLQYNYPLFQNTVKTNPPVSVIANSENLLPNSFCSFEFALSLSELKQSLDADPLLVEVLSSDGKQNDKQIGVVKVSLAQLLQAKRHEQTQCLDAYYNIHKLNKDGTVKVMGVIRMVLSIEDFGALSNNAPSVSQQPQTSKMNNGLSKSNNMQSHPTSFNDVNVEDIRAQIEEKVRWEMEIWKRTEEAKFEANYRLIQASRLESLENEIKKQQLQQEAMFAQRRKALLKSEEKMKGALFDIEKQQQKLNLRIEEQASREQLLDAQRAREHKETSMVVKRLKEHFHHQLSMKDRSIDDLKTHNGKLTLELTNMTNRFEDHQAEFRKFKIKTSKSHNGQLRLEIGAREREIKDLRENLVRVEEREKKTSAALKMTLKELARIGRLRQQEAHERLQLERVDLQRLRMQYVAKEHNNSSRRDRSELESIKRDLKQLVNSPVIDQSDKKHSNGKENISTSWNTTDEIPQMHKPIKKEEVPTENHEKNLSVANEIARLKQERDDLLSTGIYKANDPLVQALTAQIVSVSRDLSSK